MPLPSSGPLSLSDIQTEFGGSNPIGLNEYYAGGGLVPAGTTGTNGAVPSSGQIAISNFYGTAAAYNLNKSLRFRASASAYLNRTPATTTNRKVWTWSGWVKRGSLATGSDQILLRAADGSANFNMVFSSSDRIFIESGPSNLFNSQPLYRDPSAWYHVVVAFDSDNGTADNRCIVYVNGVSQVKLNGSVSSGLQVAVNTANPHYTGGNNTDRFFDGYIAELNFIDGQALTPSSFGETSSTTGVWIPKRYTGSYGTNGYYLPFTNTTSTTTLVADSSGNGNNWTPNNISLTAGITYDSMTDVPTTTNATTGNYSVWNPLNKFNASNTSNANLLITNGNSGDGWSTTGSTFAFPQTGKWYAEFTITNRPFSGTTGIGIVPSNISFVNQSGDSARFAWGRVYFDNSGIIGPNNASVQNTSQAPTYTTGDIISVAFDSDNGTVWWAKNGTWTNSGNPATGANPAYTGLTAAAFPMGFVITSEGYSSSQITGNWGQTALTYTPPSGFVRLNTFNLPTPTIGASSSTLANKYFDATLYTGNGSTQSIVNSGGFRPDLVWYKGRSTAYNHRLYDVIRGATNSLSTNLTDATDIISGVTAFNSNGFSLGSEVGGNNNGTTYVAWQWQANGAGVTNTAGSITSTISANTTAGFSIVTYTGNGTNATVGHGIGASPSMIIVKKRSSSDPWPTYHASLGVQFYTLLNATDASYNNLSNYWGSTAPSSTVFGLGPGYGGNNSNGATYVAYCFAQINGYSSINSYKGNGSSDGPFIYTGFRPEFVIIKGSDYAGADWVMYDAARNTYNALTSELNPNSAASENNFGGAARMDFVSNGIKIRTSGAGLNANGYTYIYIAFAQYPFKYANAR